MTSFWASSNSFILASLEEHKTVMNYKDVIHTAVFRDKKKAVPQAKRAIACEQNAVQTPFIIPLKSDLTTIV